MKQNFITDVVQAMLPFLNNAQTERLQEVLQHTLFDYEVTKIESDKEISEQNYMELFLAAKRIEGCSEKSLKYYKTTIDMMIATVGKSVKHIETDDIRRYLTKYQEKKKSSKVTIDNIRRILSSFFSWLEDEDYILKSPVRRIHKVKIGTNIKETYSDEALELMRDNCTEPRDLAMIDYGTFDVNKLQHRDEKGIDGIRLAFHKENWKESIEIGKIILSKGYDLYIQPMVSVRYTDDEYRELIKVCNKELGEAKGFYIVDSFGQMDSAMLLHKLELADQHVSDTMKIGLHAHNNRQLAYSNALAFISFNAKHDIMLDASIMGMGKGAGNVCTELIMESLISEGKQYKTSYLYDAISEYFSKIIKQYSWGYSLDYYLSSLYSCTPSYIKIFLQDKRITTDDLIELLKTIPEEKKAACDRKFAKEHLEQYFL